MTTDEVTREVEDGVQQAPRRHRLWPVIVLLAIVVAGVVITSLVMNGRHPRIYLPEGRTGWYLGTVDGKKLVFLDSDRSTYSGEIRCIDDNINSPLWTCVFPFRKDREMQHGASFISNVSTNNSVFVLSASTGYLFEIDLDTGDIQQEVFTECEYWIRTDIIGRDEYVICGDEDFIEVFRADDLHFGDGTITDQMISHALYRKDFDQLEIRDYYYDAGNDRLYLVAHDKEFKGKLISLTFTSADELIVETREQATGDTPARLAFDNDSALLFVFCSGAQAIEQYDPLTLEQLKVHPGRENNYGVDVRGNKAIVVDGRFADSHKDGAYGTLYTVDLKTNKCRELLLEGKYTARIIPDGNPNIVTIWNGGIHRRRWKLEGSFLQRLFNRRSWKKRSTSGHEGCSLIQVDLHFMEVIREISIADGHMRYSKDENRVYLSDEDGEFIEIIDL